MAEDDASGLDILIKQRHSRPAFARMISWEIGKMASKANEGPLQRKKRKPKDGDSDVGEEKEMFEKDDEEEEDRDEQETGGHNSREGSAEWSSESEYFSVDEEFAELWINEETGREEDGRGEGARSLSQTQESAQVSFLAASPAVSHASDSGRKRGLSKKQKRKRRRQNKENHDSVLYYAEYRAPFRDADSLDLTLMDLKDDLLTTVHDHAVSVPSLFHLCAASLWGKQDGCQSVTNTLYPVVPRSVQKAVVSVKISQDFCSQQLHWMYRTLAYLESRSIYPWYQHCHVTNVWWPFHVIRHLDYKYFETSFYGTGDGHLQQLECPERQGETMSTMVIPFTVISHGRLNRNSILSLYAQSMLASIVAMMTPTHLWPVSDRAKKNTTGTPLLGNTDDADDQALSACVAAVMASLKKRYCHVVDRFGQKVLPYIFWVKGHHKMALHHFLHLSETLTDWVERAAYLMEAVRLCQFLHHDDAARRLLRQSQEMVPDESHHAAVNEQMQLLIAKTYDQGVLSEHKAVNSLSAWAYMVSSHCDRPSTFMMAVESVLCFHLAHLPGETVEGKLEAVMPLVKECTEKHWLVPIYLSLLYAWQGDQRKSAQAYMGLISTDSMPAPGNHFLPGGAYDSLFTPWQCVVDTVLTNKQAIAPLKVIWRSQLGHVKVIEDKNVFDGDLCARPLGLRLSPEGHLTGDLQLFFPPIRAVNLDLYTGKLILPVNPGDTCVLQSLLTRHYCPNATDNTFGNMDQLFFPGGSYALTPTEVYEDSEGRQIHLMCAGGSNMIGVEGSLLSLQLTSCRGRRAKLNLTYVVGHAHCLDMKNKIKKDSYTTQEMAILTGGFDYAVKNSLSVKSLEEVCRLGCALHGSRKTTVHTTDRYWPGCGFNFLHYSHRKAQVQLKCWAKSTCTVTDFVTYGHTVCLLGVLNLNRVFLVFVDVSSRESFYQPVVRFPELTQLNRSEPLPMMKVLGGRRRDAEILCLMLYDSPSSNSFPLIYGQGGTQLDPQYLHVDMTKGCAVVGSSVYICSKESNMQRGSQALTDPAVAVRTPVTLLERKFEENSDKATSISHSWIPVDIGEERNDSTRQLLDVRRVGDRLLLVMTNGLQVVSPGHFSHGTVVFAPPQDGRACHLALSEGGHTLLIKPLQGRTSDEVMVTVLLEEKVTLTSDIPECTLVVVAVNDYLLVLSIPPRDSERSGVVQIVFCVKITGHATEAYFVSPSVGFLVSSTFHAPGETSYYRETVIVVNLQGQLLSLLPGLGPGPREFLPLQLSGTWHVYMRDGHGGIMAVAL